jgi:hypothetical protein
MKQQSFVLILLLVVVSVSCTSPERQRQNSLDTIAKDYVSLALEIGTYDEDFIDAYYGPIEWARNTNADKELPYEELKWKNTKLLNELKTLNGMDFKELELLRYRYLVKQLEAMRTKLDMMSGKILPFDVESLRLYDVVAPNIDLEEYDSLLGKLDRLLPGEGDLRERYEAYAHEFIIPAEKVDTVFRTAIAEARHRVAEKIALPDKESFILEYVTDKPWSGYNWYKGNGHSLIQINTDFPIYIERAIDLACHEGYPGHHVYNVMLEKALVIDRKWSEFQVYPLFSPQSFIAEGTANYGTKMIFTDQERLDFEKQKLFPLAGINPDQAAMYYKIQDIREALLGSQIQIARAYINGSMDAEEAIENLQKYLQYEASRARQRVQFFDRYRSYVINYSLGSELVEEHVDAGVVGDDKTRWELYIELLSTPRTASVLQAN